MDEQQILKQLNLSEADLNDLIAKFQKFAAGLNPAQRAAVESALPSASDAAKTLSYSVTESDLTSFINKRVASGSPSTALMFFIAPSK